MRPQRGTPWRTGPSLSVSVIALALSIVVGGGCSRDSNPVDAGTAGSESSVFRNLGKR